MLCGTAIESGHCEERSNVAIPEIASLTLAMTTYSMSIYNERGLKPESGFRWFPGFRYETLLQNPQLTLKLRSTDFQYPMPEP
jgi:hypothetical protein